LQQQEQSKEENLSLKESQEDTQQETIIQQNESDSSVQRDISSDVSQADQSQQHEQLKGEDRLRQLENLSREEFGPKQLQEYIQILRSIQEQKDKDYSDEDYSYEIDSSKATEYDYDDI
jgi:hypothetical protein